MSFSCSNSALEQTMTLLQGPKDSFLPTLTRIVHGLCYRIVIKQNNVCFFLLYSQSTKRPIFMSYTPMLTCLKVLMYLNKKVHIFWESHKSLTKSTHFFNITESCLKNWPFFSKNFYFLRKSELYTNLSTMYVLLNYHEKPRYQHLSIWLGLWNYLEVNGI